MSDSAAVVLGLAETLSGSNSGNWSDALAVGYGNAISDTQSLSDSLLASYGLASSETRTLTDHGVAGYGNAVSDVMALSDAAATRLDIEVIVSDDLNAWSDTLAVGHEFVIAESLTRP